MLKDILRELREGEGKKQKDIAKILGVSTSCYSNYEQGTREPSINILKAICDLYNIEMDYLLEYKRPSERNQLNFNNSFNNNNGSININSSNNNS